MSAKYYERCYANVDVHTCTERSSSVMASRTLLQNGHASVDNPYNL